MGAKEKQSIQGQVRLVLKDIRTGQVVEERVVKNSIMAGGNLLVAKLFCGEQPSRPISHVGVGTDDSQNEDLTLTSLKAPVLTPEGNADRVDIKPIEVETPYVSPGDEPETESAKVKFAATFDGDHGNGALKEAGIFNDEEESVLYNRVTFDVINKADNHTLTLVWEVTFSGTSEES